jgi:hypothetical protein
MDYGVAWWYYEGGSGAGRREWRETLAPTGNGFPRRRQVWYHGRNWAEMVFGTGLR